MRCATADARDGMLPSTKSIIGQNQQILASVNIPIVEDKFAVRLAGQFIDETGYIDNVRTFTSAINDVEESAWPVCIWRSVFVN